MYALVALIAGAYSESVLHDNLMGFISRKDIAVTGTATVLKKLLGWERGERGWGVFFVLGAYRVVLRYHWVIDSSLDFPNGDPDSWTLCHAQCPKMPWVL